MKKLICLIFGLTLTACDSEPPAPSIADMMYQECRRYFNNRRTMWAKGTNFTAQEREYCTCAVEYTLPNLTDWDIQAIKNGQMRPMPNVYMPCMELINWKNYL